MAQKKGLVSICDRCGASVFSQLIGRETFDGGYSSRDTFEERPKGWDNYSMAKGFATLCPACSEKWEKICDAFINQEPILFGGELLAGEEAAL